MAKVGVGDRAPEFELPGTGGRAYRLSEYRGRWVILASYPGGLVRRSIFILDPDGVIRHRRVALLGLHYQDIDDLGKALAAVRR